MSHRPAISSGRYLWMAAAVMLCVMGAGCRADFVVSFPPQPLAPEQVVELFHRSYGSADMDRIGAYTTAAFRDQRPVSVWVAEVWGMLRKMEYEKSGFTILDRHVDNKSGRAVVICKTTIKTAAGTSEQNEVFFLVKADNRWQIDRLVVTNEAVTMDSLQL